MNDVDRNFIEAAHARDREAIARHCRRRTDPTNEVRRQLVDDCHRIGTEAHCWLIAYREDNECEITAVAFISVMEKLDTELWTDAVLAARRSAANARANSYTHPTEGSQ